MYTNVITSHWKGSGFQPITECTSSIHSHRVTGPSLEGWSWIVTRVGGPSLLLCRGWLDDLVCIWEREVVTFVYRHMFVPVPHGNVTGGAELFWLECLIGGGGGDQVGEVNNVTAGAILADNRRFK